MFIKNVRTVSGIYGNPSFEGEDSVDYVYDSDNNLTVVTRHPVPDIGTTYYFQYVAIQTGTTTPIRTYLGRAIGAGEGDYILHESPSGDLAGPWVNGQDCNSQDSTFDVYLALKVNGPTEDQAGTYFVTEQSWNDGDSIPSPVTVTSFDLRMLALKNLKADFYNVNTNSKNNTTLIKGDWYALPASSSLYPGGWHPTSSINWDINIQDTAHLPVNEFTGTSSISLGSGGKVGTLQYRWNLKNSEGSVQQGAQFFTCTGTASVPAMGTATSAPKKNGVLALRCCGGPDGVPRIEIEIDSSGAVYATLSYNGQFVNLGPGSMGYGWSSNSNISVSEDPDSGDLSYQSESGTALRWQNMSGAYVPVHADNYSSIVKITGGPTYVYAITFPDQSQRQFDADGKILREVDRNGNTQTYAYSGGHLESITDDTGRAVYFGYGTRTDGQVVTVRANDPVTGRLTTMEYYDNTDPVSPNRLKMITNPVGDTQTFIYDEAGNITQILDTRGNAAATYTYDELGRKLTEQNYDQQLVTYTYSTEEPTTTIVAHDLTETSPDRSVTYTYDALSNIVQVAEIVDDENTNITAMTYADPINPYLVTQTLDPNLNPTSMTYNSLGNLTTYTNAQGYVTTYQYAEDIDALLNPKHRNLLRKIYRSPRSVVGELVTYPPTELQYDNNGNLVAAIDAQSQTTIFTVLSNGLIDSITDRRGNTTSFTYDSHRNLASVTTPAGPDMAPSRTTTFGYDEYDNMVSATDPLGNSVQYQFDEADRPTQITDARGKYVVMNYLQGLLDSVEAPANAGSTSYRRLTQYSYDTANRVSAVNSQVSTTASQLRVGYGYDGFSNLNQVQRLMNGLTKSVTTQYDALGRISSSTDFVGQTTRALRAPYCNVESIFTPRGQQLNISKDNLCRVSNQFTLDEARYFFYDELDRLTTVLSGSTYNFGDDDANFDALYGQAAAGKQTSYAYDSLDRVTQVDYSNGDSVSYQYDEEGNVTQKTDSNGNISLYEYYNDNRLYKLTFQAPGQDDQLFVYAYDAAGRLDSIAYPATTGLKASFTTTTGASGWNENGQLVCLRYLKTGGVHFHRFEYQYDDAGNRTQLIDTPTNTANAVTWDYSYDWLNRLTEVSRNTVLSAQYAYDESDNRVSLTLPAVGEVYSYGYDLADRILSRTLTVSGTTVEDTFTHDLDGNMTTAVMGASGQTITYKWSGFNKLLQRQVDDIPKESNAYDAEGIRYLKRDETSGQIFLLWRHVARR